MLAISGVMEVASGKLRISDPCYARKDVEGGHAHVVDALPGLWVWKAELLPDPEPGNPSNVAYRVAALEAAQYNALGHRDTPRGWDGRSEYLVDVDSGQMSIVDDAEYPEKSGDYESKGWYYDVCQVTLTDQRAGAIEKAHPKKPCTVAYGCVSGTFMGDGQYGVTCEYVLRRPAEFKAGLTQHVWKVRVDFWNDPKED